MALLTKQASSPALGPAMHNIPNNKAIRLDNVTCAYRVLQRRDPLGSADILLTDENGDTHVFACGSFCYHHQSLTIGLYKHPHFAAVAA